MLRNRQVVITLQERTKNRYQKYILYTNKKIQATNVTNAQYISVELRPIDSPNSAYPILKILKLTR